MSVLEGWKVFYTKCGKFCCICPLLQFCDLGNVTSIEANHKPVDMARKGSEVCIKIESSSGDAPKMYGRHFDHEDLLVSKVQYCGCPPLHVLHNYGTCNFILARSITSYIFFFLHLGCYLIAHLACALLETQSHPLYITTLCKTKNSKSSWNQLYWQTPKWEKIGLFFPWSCIL